MIFSDYFPVWDKLTTEQQEILENASYQKVLPEGSIASSGVLDCFGLLLVRSGQLRAYILSDKGHEVTIYRLFEMDICLFSASCIMRSLQFDITIEAEKDTEVWVIPPDVYKKIMEESAPLANYTNEIMSSRFSDVMWLIEQVMWKSFDQRLADFLLEESIIEDSTMLKITHEKISNHLGTAREVVTRMLRYFQNEDIIKLTRGAIDIIDIDALKEIQRRH